jgi:hypothetical protein
MTNAKERNSEHKQPKPTDTADQYKKNPTRESGQHQPKQQNPSKKDPSQADDSRQRNRDASEQAEKRGA